MGEGVMARMCPNCGLDLEPDRPLVSGDWRVSPLEVSYCGEPIRLTSQQRAMLYALAKAGGQPISRDALLNRVSDSESANLISVLVCRLRQTLPVVPFEIVWGVGIRWTGELPQIAEAA
jgi:DNA-binding response OmpR family regulator